MADFEIERIPGQTKHSLRVKTAQALAHEVNNFWRIAIEAHLLPNQKTDRFFLAGVQSTPEIFSQLEVSVGACKVNYLNA
jgi:hypothetical protein